MAQSPPLSRRAIGSIFRAFGRGAVQIGRRCGLALRAVVGWIPLTFPGLAIAAALIWVTNVYGIQRSDRILMGVGMIGLAFVGVGMATVLVTALWLRLRREPSGVANPLVMEADEPTVTGYRLGWVRWNPWVRIEIAWERPAGARAEIARLPEGWLEQVTTDQRAFGAEIVRRFVVTDNFGLARIRFQRRTAVDVKILPHRGEFKPGQFNAQQYVAGDQISHPEGPPDGDRIEMRRYVPGDPIKLVLWKVFARTGQLLVRTPERAVNISQKTMLHLISGAGDEPAAGICRGWLEGNSAGIDILFGSDGDEPPTSIPSEMQDQIARSVAARDHGGEGLESTLAAGENQGFKSILLFVPPAPGPWLDRVVALLSAFKDSKRAIVAIDDARRPKMRPISRWLFDANVEANDDSFTGLTDVCRRLAAAGVEVSIVDRVSGAVRQATEFDEPIGEASATPAPERVLS